MMAEMNDKLNKIFDETTDEEKGRLLYELATYFVSNSNYEKLSPDMQNLVEDLSNVINDIDNM